jgi:hypothetical protein
MNFVPLPSKPAPVAAEEDVEDTEDDDDDDDEEDDEDDDDIMPDTPLVLRTLRGVLGVVSGVGLRLPKFWFCGVPSTLYEGRPSVGVAPRR